MKYSTTQHNSTTTAGIQDIKLSPKGLVNIGMELLL